MMKFLLAPMQAIDAKLNGITMYRLVLNGLFVLTGISILLSFGGYTDWSPWMQLLSALILLVASYISNTLFAAIFKTPFNAESSSITALLLFFILEPAQPLTLILTAIIANASKYILALNKRHIFNPAAIGAVILALAGNGAAYWWIGTGALLPIVLVIGLLIVRKIHRGPMVGAFVAAALAATAVTSYANNFPLKESLQLALLSGPLVFFGTFMLTEPLSSPTTLRNRIWYGILVGVLFGTQYTFGPVHSSPETALIIGNMFAYLVSSKQKLILTLTATHQLAIGVYEFVFKSDKKLDFQAGQYMEWTLPLAKPDSRGNRRYFTIASSPTEADIKLGVRILSEQASAFKQKLLSLKPGDTMTAMQVAGDFTLPKNSTEKLVFIAGGIGITPFRSMIKYLLDNNEKRDIVLFYCARDAKDLAYTELFAEASRIGLKTVYLTGQEKITEALLGEHASDCKNRTYYLSGPSGMVDGYKTMLKAMGVKNSCIKTDYFPGF